MAWSLPGLPRRLHFSLVTGALLTAACGGGGGGTQSAAPGAPPAPQPAAAEQTLADLFNLTALYQLMGRLAAGGPLPHVGSTAFFSKVERVTAIARRGPVERKYNPKEIRAVCTNMNQDGIATEFARIKDRLAAVGQNADEVLASMTAEFTKCEPTGSPSKMGFRFLASPKRVLVDSNNRVRALEMEENTLEPKGDDTAAVGLKQLYECPVDGVVFAVGDRVDETVVLPYKNGVYVTNPNKTGNDPDDSLFQAYDEKSGQVVDGVFLAGWARKASEGLVGIAKRDGDC